MALLEILRRPLFNAQREAGIEIGREEGKVEGEAAADAQFEAWEERQRAAGVQFVNDEPPQDQPEAE